MRRTADGLEIFLLCLRFFIKFNKIAMRGNRQKKPKICGDPLGDRSRDLFASVWLKTWREICLHFSESIALKVSNTLRAIPKE
jgi:hypothetical protein